jgi:hypothetical protein
MSLCISLLEDEADHNYCKAGVYRGRATIAEGRRSFLWKAKAWLERKLAKKCMEDFYERDRLVNRLGDAKAAYRNGDESEALAILCDVKDYLLSYSCLLDYTLNGELGITSPICNTQSFKDPKLDAIGNTILDLKEAMTIGA